MRRLTHYVRAGGMALVLAFLGSGAGFNICLASPATPPSPTTVGAQQEQIQVDNDDSIHLSPDALPAPASYGPFNRFGLLISSAQQFASPTRAIRLDYTATIPTGSAVLLDVRGSVDGVRWTSWEVDLSSGAKSMVAPVGRLTCQVVQPSTLPRSYSMYSIEQHY